uniref:Major facilitator superfamily (MFS) profile domain-containing protein n=1 Tax=Mycena chlorophos TaxID=658473 RepID=A0ABQ0L6L1_MYCCL|nr:predicted protein [Mycena chlorophos]
MSQTDEKPTRDDLYDSNELDAEYLRKTKILNQAITDIGFGRYHWYLFICAGFGWFADSVWPLITGLILNPVLLEFAFNTPFLSLAANCGLLVGAIVWGVGSDIWGRRWSFNLTLLIAGVFGLAAGGSADFVQLAALLACVGVGVGGNLPVDSAVFLDLVPASHQYLLTVMSIWWCLGQLLISLLAWPLIANFTCSAEGPCTMKDNMGWRYLLYILGALTLLFCIIRFLIFNLMESPRYLIGIGNDEKAVEVVHRLAAYNSTTTTLSVSDFHQGVAEDEKPKENTSRPVISSTSALAASHFKTLFATRKMALSTSLLISIWGIIGLASTLYNNFLPFLLASRGAKFGDGSLYLTYRNNLILSVIGVPGAFLAGWAVELPYLGRKGTLSISCGLTGAFLFATTTARSSPELLGWNCGYTFFSNIMYGVLYAVSPEIFPGNVRGTGNAMVSTSTRVFGVLAPIIALYADLATAVPVYISGALIFGAGLLVWLLPFERGAVFDVITLFPATTSEVISMPLPLFCVGVLAWAAVVSAVTVAFPIDDQRPLIARIGHPYAWSFSPATFSSPESISYKVSALPDWLGFDPATHMFQGTPGPDDEGNIQITATAHDSTSSASSTFSLCITSFPCPEIGASVQQQFAANNPAMSSVFPIANNSALATGRAALRIPPKWSFSIGFRYDTLVGPDNVYYAVQQANGSGLPDWMMFRTESLTLNGVVPHDIPEAYTLSLSLVGSDQEGYSAVTLPFDLVTATHEVVQLQNIPVFNVTAGVNFTASVTAPTDFEGVIVDGEGIVPANISSLFIDTSSVSGWLQYDEATRMLSGTPPDGKVGQKFVLPMSVSSFNQTLHTTCTVAIVPSFFSTPTIPSQMLSDTRIVNFDLTEYFSNSTGDQSGDVNLSSSSDTPEGDCLTFDPNSYVLSGTVPDDISVSHMDFTFTAFSRVTHSTSKTFFSLEIPPPSKSANNSYKHPKNLSAAAHRKLTIALAAVFAVLGTGCALGLFFSALRRCARVEDGAKVDQAAWSESDKRWYGLVAEEKGATLPRNAMELENPFGEGAELVTPPRPTPDYGALGLGLRRVAERSGSNPLSSPGSPGVMRKGEFMTRIRQTVRRVSDKCGSWHGLPVTLPPSPSNPFDDANIISSYPGSTVLTTSPSTSTGEHSIPRRRADFAPPRVPTAAHMHDGLSRQPSSGSISSNEEGVVYVASKATSIRSEMARNQRPRLVPFTSATRVPVPRTPSPNDDAPDSPTRVTSQRVVVMKESNRNSAADELSVGIQYVRALGADQEKVKAEASTPTVSTHVRSSFSSLESSHHGHTGSNMRTLVRAGEKFRFRTAVSMYSAASYRQLRKLEAKLLQGTWASTTSRYTLWTTTHASAALWLRWLEEAAESNFPVFLEVIPV